MSLAGSWGCVSPGALADNDTSSWTSQSRQQCDEDLEGSSCAATEVAFIIRMVIRRIDVLLEVDVEIGGGLEGDKSAGGLRFGIHHRANHLQLSLRLVDECVCL